MQDRPIGEDVTASARQVVRRYTVFRSLDRLFTRGEVALEMVRDFSKCGVRDLAIRALQELADTNTVSAMDLYGRSTQDARQILRQQFGENVAIQETRVSGEDACIKNLRQMDWTIEQGKAIELLVNRNDDTVVGVRTPQSQEADLTRLQRLYDESQAELATLRSRASNLEERVSRLEPPG